MKFETLYNSIKITPILETLELKKISDAEYFSATYGDYISNSRLGLLYKKKGGSCQKFLDGLGADNQFNASFLLGSAVHMQVLQPEYFTLAPALERPSAKAGMMADIIYSYKDHLPTIDRLKDAAIKTDYYHGLPTAKQLQTVKEKMTNYLIKRAEWDVTNTDKREVQYLDDKTLETVKGCINALNNNAAVQTLLHPEDPFEEVESENEQAIILECQVNAPDLNPFTIKLKSKLDNYTIDPNSNTITVNDVKTTSKPVNMFGEALRFFTYEREMSMYSTLLKMVVEKYKGMKNPIIASNFLVVNTCPPYDTAIYPMTDELFRLGGMQFNYLLRLAAIAMYFKDQNKYLEYLHGLQDETKSI